MASLPFCPAASLRAGCPIPHRGHQTHAEFPRNVAWTFCFLSHPRVPRRALVIIRPRPPFQSNLVGTRFLSRGRAERIQKGAKRRSFTFGATQWNASRASPSTASPASNRQNKMVSLPFCSASVAAFSAIQPVSLRNGSQFMYAGHATKPSEARSNDVAAIPMRVLAPVLRRTCRDAALRALRCSGALSGSTLATLLQNSPALKLALFRLGMRSSR